MAEVLSFRLKVPRSEVERVVDYSGRHEVPVALTSEGAELVLSAVNGESLMRFRPIGRDAILTEIVVANDPLGLFFHRILGPLMLRFQGDLHARLTWNTAERNVNGDYTDVKITRGSTRYPGLVNSIAQQPVEDAAADALEDTQDLDDSDLTTEEKEIRDLMLKAKAHWDEYVKLKARRDDEQRES
jgi:hypothetical protein